MLQVAFDQLALNRYGCVLPIQRRIARAWRNRNGHCWCFFCSHGYGRWRWHTCAIAAGVRPSVGGATPLKFASCIICAVVVSLFKCKMLGRRLPVAALC